MTRSETLKTSSLPGAPNGTNVVVIRGVLARPPDERQLPNGERVLGFELRVAVANGRAESVPIAWFGAPTTATDLREGSEVVVVGRVRRRFFRIGAQTQSRTEVVADCVVSTRSIRRAAEAVKRAAAELTQSL